MHPTIFVLPGGWPIHAYGTAILVGGLLAMPGVHRDLRAHGLGAGRTGSMLVDLYLVLVFGAALGGRVVHVLTSPRGYLDDPLRVLALDGTGFVFFGSLAAIALGLVWLARRYDAPVSRVCDVAATWMPLGHLFGRLGCLLAGCCFGAAGDVPWALSFPPQSVAWASNEVARTATGTVPLHPTQLYEVAGLAMLWLVLLSRRGRIAGEAPWRQTCRYAVGYGVVRACTELVRGDASRGFVVELTSPGLASVLGVADDHVLALSISQAVAAALAIVGATWLVRTRHATPADAPPAARRAG